MSMRQFFSISLTMVTSTLWFVAGCNQNSQEVSVTPKRAPTADAGEDEFNPHDVPLTEEQKTQLKKDTAQFSDAVAKAKELCNEIDEATKDGIPQDPYEAHQSLDKADLVLQWLPQVARNSGVAKEHWEEINTAANDLRTSLEKIHENIDNRQDPNFASVAQDVDQKISQLEEIAQRQSESGGEG